MLLTHNKPQISSKASESLLLIFETMPFGDSIETIKQLMVNKNVKVRNLASLLVNFIDYLIKYSLSIGDSECDQRFIPSREELWAQIRGYFAIRGDHAFQYLERLERHKDAVSPLLPSRLHVDR